jgi:hypothetical protein
MINTLTLLRPRRLVQVKSLHLVMKKLASVVGYALLAIAFLFLMAFVFVVGLFIRTSEKQY